MLERPAFLLIRLAPPQSFFSLSCFSFLLFSLQIWRIEKVREKENNNDNSNNNFPLCVCVCVCVCGKSEKKKFAYFLFLTSPVLGSPPSLPPPPPPPPIWKFHFESDWFATTGCCVVTFISIWFRFLMFDLINLIGCFLFSFLFVAVGGVISSWCRALWI